MAGQSPTVRFPVEAGHIMMFARALGDPNPVYSDPDYAATTECGGIIAPPTFPQASAQFDPDYPLRPRIGEPWLGSGLTPSSAEGDAGISYTGGSGLGSGLHAEQHFEYHRPLRPGDVLVVEVKAARTWEKQGRRGGRLTFIETVTEYRDQEDRLVVRARDVTVRPERMVEER